MSSIVVREIGSADRTYWDDHVQAFAHAHPLNVFDWGAVRRIDGWRARHLVAERDGAVCGVLLLLSRRIVPLLPYSIFYGPHGPVCGPADAETVRALHEHVARVAKKEHAIFIRIDPNIRDEEAGHFRRTLTELGYANLEQRWTFWNVPRDEYRIDLASTASADELHEALDRDTRRCIRKAGRDGLSIVPATTESELARFFSVFKEYSITRGFMSRGLEYQKTLWDSYIVPGRGRLFLAIYQGNIIGGLICIMFARKCVAMHMGTPYEYQKLQPSYAYVWESIRWAKESGCEWYSFRGVGTTPTQEAFKRKFNPKVVALAGYFDRPFKPFLYKIFYWLEFTLLPASWPLIVRSRRVTRGVLKRVLAQPAT